MKKSVLLSAVLLLALSGVASAYSINYLSSTDSNGGLTTPYSDVRIETFDKPLIFTWSGNGVIEQGSVVNHNKAPSNGAVSDTTKYMSVPDNLYGLPTQTKVADLGGFSTYLGLWWGSVDTYNTLSFFNGATKVAEFTGADILLPANGTISTYVNFLDMPAFDSFAMTSTHYAFEADNIAVSAVPEPGTMLLLGAGFLSLAIYGKRRRNG